MWPVEIPEKEYIDALIATLRHEVQLAWDSHQREHSTHEIAHGREHIANEQAIDKAENGLLLRFDSVNEFRRTLADQTSTFITRANVEEQNKALRADIARLDIEMGRRLTALELAVNTLHASTTQMAENGGRISAIEKQQSTLSGRDKGVSLLFAGAATVIGVVATIIGVMLALLR